MTARSDRFLFLLEEKLETIGFYLRYGEYAARYHQNYFHPIPLGHLSIEFYLSEEVDGTFYLQWECGLASYPIQRLLAEAHKEPYQEGEIPYSVTIGISFPDLSPNRKGRQMKFEADISPDSIAQLFIDEFTKNYFSYLKQFQTLDDIFAAMPITSYFKPMSFANWVHSRVIRVYIIFLTKDEKDFEAFVEKDRQDIERNYSDIDIANYGFHINFLKGKYKESQ